MNILVNLIVSLSRGTSGVFVAGLTLLLIFMSLIRKDPPMMVLAALFAIPATYVMGSWSGVGIFVRLLPLFLLASAFATAKDEMLFSWVLSVPVLGLLIFFLFKLVSSGFSGFNL